MSKPISPDEITEAKAASLPDDVYDAFNELIVKNISQGKAVVTKKDVAASIANKLNISIQEIYNKGYLNVEEIYRKAGWTVEFNSPSYDENYDAYFTFSKK